MFLESSTMISPSAGLILWTVVAVTTFAVIGWLVLVVVPRNLSASARWAARRRPG